MAVLFWVRNLSFFSWYFVCHFVLGCWKICGCCRFSNRLWWFFKDLTDLSILHVTDNARLAGKVSRVVFQCVISFIFPCKKKMLWAKFTLNHFSPIFHFYTPLETSENLWSAFVLIYCFFSFSAFICYHQLW